MVQKVQVVGGSVQGWSAVRKFWGGRLVGCSKVLGGGLLTSGVPRLPADVPRVEVRHQPPTGSRPPLGGAKDRRLSGITLGRWRRVHQQKLELLGLFRAVANLFG